MADTSTDQEDVWPSWLEKFRNDFRSAKDAQENDGLKGPHFERPSWIDEAGAVSDETLDAAKRAHQQALDRIASAESRATRLVQMALTLLALTLTVTGFEIGRLRSVAAGPWAWGLVLLPSTLAIVCIALSAVQAIGVDRASLVEHAKPGALAVLDDAVNRKRNLVLQEVHAAHTANWTGRNKLNEFLQARAWLTRGIVALTFAGLSALGIWFLTAPPNKDAKPVRESTTEPGSRREPPSNRRTR